MDKDMMSGNPKVTVLMPVFNGEQYLREALQSILSQTFGDFEFLIIDDGSTDRSVEIIHSYHDPRIHLVRNEKNRGVIAALNRGIELAHGEYVARMDCDDISLPQRLHRQVAFMDTHPEIGVCGTWFRRFGGPDPVVDRPPTDPDKIRCGHFFNSRLGHPTVMMRTHVFRQHALYFDKSYPHAEDFELWVRTLAFFDIANIGEVLLLYRVHGGQVSERFTAEMMESSGRVRKAQLARLGLRVTDRELEFHQSVCTSRFTASVSFMEAADAWLCRIKESNDALKTYPEPAFSEVLLERWFSLCYRTVEKGLRMPWLFLNPKLLKKTGLGRPWVARFLARAAFDMVRDRLNGSSIYHHPLL